MSAAGDLIRALEAGGLTQREIARRINRGPSYVSKVATGRKPGGGLESSLRALQRGAGSAHAPRRRTRAGYPAAVRRPAREAYSAPSGRIPGLRGPEAVRAGMRPDGFGGSAPVAWDVRAWRGPDGWHDLGAGDGGWTNPGRVEYVVLNIEGIGLRQFAAFLTDDYDLADFVADVLDQYGVAE